MPMPRSTRDNSHAASLVREATAVEIRAAEKVLALGYFCQRRGRLSLRSCGRWVLVLSGILIVGWMPGAPLPAQQSTIPADQLDPARNSSELKPLARTVPFDEQYVWTEVDQTPALKAPQADSRRWEFRRVFALAAVSRRTTLYVAASGDVEVWLNGQRLLAYFDNRTLRPGFTVHALDVADALHAGENALAVCVTHLHGAHHTTTDAMTLQFVGGRALAVKIVPAARGIQAPPLLVSDTKWQARTLTGPATGADDLAEISTVAYNAAAWRAAESLGGLEGNIAFYQWNADAGMYAWPGYVGASSFLRHYTLKPIRVVQVYAGSAKVSDAGDLIGTAQSSADFAVKLSPHSADELSPALMLDFGREVAGRIHLRSASDQPILVSTSYGESEDEALFQPFLGRRTIYVPPQGDAYGPKSGFRYVYVRFLSDARLAAIDLDGIAYPVEYKGAFHSSDAMLNRIWETGAYTAHLCMQDGIWDGVKRDRARWAGDLDVSGRVIDDVFADRELMEETLMQLLEETRGAQHVNGITGYSALWIHSLTDFYRDTGDREFLLRMHSGMLALLRTMNSDMGSDGLFSPSPHEHVFVDWSPELSSNTAEARRATDFEYLLAFKDAAWLLSEAGDQAGAARYDARYKELCTKARSLLMNPATHTFGSTVQTNAMAIVSGAATEADYPELWTRVFASIDTVTPASPHITPYYGFYILEAMAQLGHRAEAAQWLRDFWGGMIAEGATSFWESYDPRWTKRHFHTGLQADGLAGYYVSLAHGWSAGPTAWLSEQLLGVRATGAGFRTVTIEPELAGLQWIEGAVPTPQGPIHLHAESQRIVLDLPEGIDATLMVKASAEAVIRVNGATVAGRAAPSSGYRNIHIDRAGHYEIAVQAR
jgi:alpha-L-rhamnosidase